MASTPAMTCTLFHPDLRQRLARGSAPIAASGAVARSPEPWFPAQRIERDGQNLIANPSAENFDTGFGNFVGGSLARVTSDARLGGACIRKTPSGDNHGIVVAVSLSLWTPGETYTASAWVKGVAGEAIRIRLTNGSGQNSTGPLVTFTGGWQRLAVTRTTDLAPVGALEVVVFGGTAAETPSPWLLDAVQVEPGDRASSYLDGSLGEGYAWTGAAHASASTRAAADVSAAGYALSPARGGVLAWVVPDWAANDGLEHVVLHRRDTANEALLLARTAAGAWRLEATAGGAVDAVELAATHAAGEAVLVAAGWSERRLELRVGSASAVATRTHRPPQIAPGTRVQLGRRQDVVSGHLDGGMGPMAWLAEPPDVALVTAVTRLRGLPSRLSPVEARGEPVLS